MYVHMNIKTQFSGPFSVAHMYLYLELITWDGITYQGSSLAKIDFLPLLTVKNSQKLFI